MKKLFLILNLFCLVAFVNCTVDDGDEIDLALDFTTNGNYFVKNTFQVDSIGSFLVVHDSASFEEVFGAAAVMGNQTWITTDDFKDKFVVSVIKKFGNNKYDLKITKISLRNAIIRVDYNFSLIEKDLPYSRVGTAIAMVKKQQCDAIQFYENGRFVKEIGMPD